MSRGMSGQKDRWRDGGSHIDAGGLFGVPAGQVFDKILSIRSRHRLKLFPGSFFDVDCVKQFSLLKEEVQTFQCVIFILFPETKFNQSLEGRFSTKKISITYSQINKDSSTIDLLTRESVICMSPAYPTIRQSHAWSTGLRGKCPR